MASSWQLGNDALKLLGHDRKEGEEDFCHAMHLTMSSVMSMCLQTTIELGVFDIIAKAGKGAKLSPAEIVAKMSTNNPDASAMLDRILRLLASHSVLSCSVVSDDNGSNFRSLYSLSPVSQYFVTNEEGVSLGPMITMSHDKVLLDSWPLLKNSILDGGIAFNRAHGTHVFEYAGLDHRFNKVVNRAMQNHTTIVINKILEHYNGFQDLKQLIDVGGGVGVTLNQITSKYPHIKGINFDLPHVVENASSFQELLATVRGLKLRGLKQELNIDHVAGIEHVGGDMFESVPRGDAIFLKTILHDWSDEHCLKLLKNCYKAIPENGKVIVVEMILPVTLETSFLAKSTLALDVGLMTQTLGGKERSQQEFLALATGAGFSGIRFVCFVCLYWVMEFYK